MGLKGGTVYVYTLHYTLKKSRLLWPVMMNDSAPTHERRKLVKTYTKMCSLENGLWLLIKSVGRPTHKNVIMWRRKTATDVINHENQKGLQKERE